MYAWIWRQLPGPWAVRAFLTVLLIIGVVALLMFVIFPWVEPMLPFNDVVVDGAGTD